MTLKIVLEKDFSKFCPLSCIGIHGDLGCKSVASNWMQFSLSAVELRPKHKRKEKKVFWLLSLLVPTRSLSLSQECENKRVKGGNPLDLSSERKLIWGQSAIPGFAMPKKVGEKM